MGNGQNNFSVKSEKRFDDTLERRASQIPGPGQYQPKTEIGSYVLDRYKNMSTIAFTKQSRLVTLDTSETRKITPGPGTYRAPSEFGYYEISTPQLAKPVKSLTQSKSALGLYNASTAVKQSSTPRIRPNNISTQIQKIQ